MRVDMTVPSNTDYELQVYKGSTYGSEIGGSYNAAGNSENIEFVVMPNTTYYVKVYTAHGGFSSNAYNLTLSSLPDIKAVTPGTSISSYISSPKDTDIWKFTTGNDKGSMTVGLTVPSNVDYELQIYRNLDGSEISGSYNGSGKAESASFSVEANTTYYIKIYGSNGNYSNSLSYQLSTSSLPVKVDNNEPNDSDGQAVTINLGISFNSYISSETDFDIWKFTTGADNAGSMHIGMTVPSGVDYELQVYKGNTSGNAISGSYNGAGEAESVDFSVMPSTTYFVKIYNSHGGFSSNPYTLILGALPQKIDNYEPNETDATAINATPNNSYNSYISLSTDYDIWKFTTGSDNAGSMHIGMTVPSGVDYELQVYKGNTAGEAIEGSYNGAGEAESVDIAVMPNTTYFVKIYNSHGGFSSNPYTLILGALPQRIDNYEPNETDSKAVNTTPNNSYNSYISLSTDYDIWKFTTGAENAGSMHIGMTVPSGVDYELQVYKGNTAGEAIEGSYNGAGQAESVDVSVMPNTTYYVKIYTSNGFSSSPYTLILGALPQRIDNYEPNETDATAINAPPNNAYDSYISLSTDYDIWKFTTGANNAGSMHIGMTVPSDADYELQVYKGNTAGEAIAGSYNGAGQAESADIAVMPNTTYFVKIYNYNGTFSSNPYTLILGALPQRIDNYEPNETDATAINAPPNNAYDSYISLSNDYDIWKFTTGAENAGSMHIGMTVPSGVDYELQVYKGNTAGEAIEGSYNGAGQAESVDVSVMPNTTYYVKIYTSNGFSSSPYTLILGALPQRIDNYEPNETDATAINAPPNNAYDSYISLSTDYDIWKFTTGANNAGSMHIGMTVPSDADYELQVYKGNTAGVAIAGSYNGAGQAESADIAVMPNTTYFVKIYNYNGTFSSNPYTLNLGALPQRIDNYEPNETDATAINAPPNNAYDSYISLSTDYDIWKFTTGADNAGSMHIGMTVPSGVDYELQVYEGSTTGSDIAGSYNGAGEAESADFSVLPNKTYFVKIYTSHGGFSSNPYRLTLGALPIVMDNNEPNNSDAQATSVNPGNAVESYISSDTDYDIWKFTSGNTSAGRMHIDMTVPSNKDYELQVYKGSTAGSEIAGSYNGAGEAESVDFVVTPNTTYYVKVYNSHGVFSSEAYHLILGQLPEIKSISPGTSETALLTSEHDFNIWKFTTGPENRGRMTAGMAVPSNVDYELQVYKDLSGNEIGWSYNGVGQAESASFTVEANTTYYIKIYNANGTFNATDPYTLTLSPLPSVIDNNEPNNDDAHAKTVVPGQSLISYISSDTDFDIWKFSTGERNWGGVSITMDMPSDVDYEIQVYKGNTSGNEVAGSYNGVGEKEKIKLSVEPNSDYFIKVYRSRNSSYSAAPYTLFIGSLPELKLLVPAIAANSSLSRMFPSSCGASRRAR